MNGVFPIRNEGRFAIEKIHANGSKEYLFCVEVSKVQEVAENIFGEKIDGRQSHVHFGGCYSHFKLPAHRAVEKAAEEVSTSDALPKKSIYSRGSYVGGFKQGLPHGRGKLKFADGGSYEGEFYEGLYHGSGMLQMKGIVYTGEFKRGKFDGEGRLTILVQGVFKSHYSGNFVDGLYSGYGILETPGLTYVGMFEKNLFHGDGKKQYNDNLAEEGWFQSGEYYGVIPPIGLLFDSLAKS